MAGVRPWGAAFFPHIRDSLLAFMTLPPPRLMIRTNGHLAATPGSRYSRYLDPCRAGDNGRNEEITMNLARMKELKELVRCDSDLKQIGECFKEHFGEDPAFLALGEGVRDSRLERMAQCI